MSNVFVKEGRIVNAKGKEIILKGINFGGWLLMEGYILGGRNIPESEFKKNFSRIYGVEELKRFEHAFRKNFITHQDFMKVKKWGFNCVRIPFHYKIFEEKPFKYKDEGIKILDWIVKMRNNTTTHPYQLVITPFYTSVKKHSYLVTNKGNKGKRGSNHPITPANF